MSTFEENLVQIAPREQNIESSNLFDLLKKEQGKLNDEEIVSRYMEIEKNLEPKYLEEVEAFSSELGALSDSCELAIVVPAYQEEGRIEHALELLLNKNSLSKEKYEVLLVINYPEGEIPDKTRLLAENFKKANNITNLHIIEKAFPNRIASVGAARKLGSDIALLRYKKRLEAKPKENILYIAGTDADILDVPSNHYVDALEKLKKDKVDVLRGITEIDIKSLTSKLPREFWNTHPNLAKFLKIRTTMAAIRKETLAKSEAFNITGSDYFIHTPAYARMGGIPRLKTGEDDAIAIRATELKLHCASLDAENIIVSPRRSIFEFEQMSTSTNTIYEPERFTKISKEIRASGSSEKNIFDRAMKLPDITTEDIFLYFRNQIKDIAMTVYIHPNIYLDVALEWVFDIVHKKIKEAELPFSPEKLSQGLIEDLTKDTFKNLFYSSERRRSYRVSALAALKSAEDSLQNIDNLPNIKLVTKEKATDYYENKKREAEFRIAISDILEKEYGNNFEKVYAEKIEKLETKRKNIEIKMRALSAEISAMLINKK